MQMSYQQQAREAEKEEERREFEAGVAANKLCQEKIDPFRCCKRLVVRSLSLLSSTHISLGIHHGGLMHSTFGRWSGRLHLKLF